MMELGSVGFNAIIVGICSPITAGAFGEAYIPKRERSVNVENFCAFDACCT
jgi:hypothetical protein